MSRLRITISGEQGTGKSTLAAWLAGEIEREENKPFALQISVDGTASDRLEGREVYCPGVPKAVTKIEIITLTEKVSDFADSLLGKIEGKRFDKADAEIAHHVRRLLECGLLPVGVARRMLSKSAKAKPGGDLITDPGAVKS